MTLIFIQDMTVLSAKLLDSFTKQFLIHLGPLENLAQSCHICKQSFGPVTKRDEVGCPVMRSKWEYGLYYSVYNCHQFSD